MRVVGLLFAALMIGRNFAAADDQPAQSRVLDFDPDWTPRPQEGDVPAYVKETDVDWVDDRLRQVDTGRTWNATFRYAESGLTPDPNVPDDQPTRRVRTHRSFKGTAVRLGDNGEAGIIFDRNQCRWACAWTGDFLWHSDRRFGLLNTPQPAGDVQFSTPAGAGWSRRGGGWPEAPTPTGPLPRDWAHFLAIHRHQNRTVFEYNVAKAIVMDFPWFERHGDVELFTRTLLVLPARGTTEPLQVLIADAGQNKAEHRSIRPADVVVWTDAQGTSAVALIGNPSGCDLRVLNDGRIVIHVPPSPSPALLRIGMTHADRLTDEALGAALSNTRPAEMKDVVAWLEPGPPVWTEQVTTRGEVVADDGPLVVDTITVPYENPYHALFFASGVDFLPSGELAVSTVHGDVWLVSGVDEDLDEIVWKRFATGLYQPLGLKVVDGKIHVLERGQLTRLLDLNGDGTADVYESVNGDWHVGGGEHSFDTCLETDPEDNWYFHSTGDPQTPTGGTVMKVSPDGSTSEVFCTGFRHPIGMGVLPDGRITGADQEGNWMPSTRIDIYRKGGFYGDMRAHHRDVPPETYDGPLCWLPRQMDGSAGGQVSVPEGLWGPFGGRTLHMSFGQCRMMLMIMQRIGDVEQAGAVDLGLQFIAGIQRGRFRPSDGHLYIVGMDGWQTAAVVDGCLQRVRYTGLPFRIPLDLAVEPTGLRITFSTPLDREIAANVERYHIEQWNYRWREEYGSPRYSVAHPQEEGQDEVSIESVRVSEDGREVFLAVPDLKPVMQMQIEYRLADVAGTPLDGVIYNTIHTTGE